MKVTLICKKCGKVYSGERIRPDIILLECVQCNENHEHIIKDDEMYWETGTKKF